MERERRQSVDWSTPSGDSFVKVAGINTQEFDDIPPWGRVLLTLSVLGECWNLFKVTVDAKGKG
jgi:hypothetical protein